MEITMARIRLAVTPAEKLLRITINVLVPPSTPP
jgi:hypothetical protein